MVNLMKLLGVALVILVTMPNVQAQENNSENLGTMTVGAVVRPRVEMKHGYKSLADSAQKVGVAISQRTRINLGFKNEKVEAKIVLQDVRTWGSQPQLVSTDGHTTTIHEAWGKVALADNFAIKLGRQEIAYDDHRVMGSVGWAQQARSHDAMILMYETDEMKIHGGFAYNQNAPFSATTVYNLPKSYKTFQYIWFNKKFGPVAASVLLLNNGKQVKDVLGNVYYDTDGYGRVNFTQTMGFRASLNEKDMPIKANLSFYYQMGRGADTLNNFTNPTAAGTQVGAYYLGADVSYTLDKKYTFALGMEMLSGNTTVVDVNNTDATAYNKAFAPLYGTNHKFNGYMDYFYVGNHTANVGLTDVFLKIKAKLTDNIMLGLDAHAFMANAPMADPTDATKAMGSFLGTEIDFSASHKINNWTAVKAGYSQMFGTESMAVLKGTSNQYTGAMSNWAYIMITINPSHTFELKKKVQ